MNKYIFITGIIGPLTTLSLIFIDISLSSYFSWYVNSLSSLGIHNYYYLFDSAVIFEGVMNTIFAISLYGIYPIKFLSIGMIIIGSISLFFVGIFNENTGMLHLTFALLYFIVLPLGIIIFSLFHISKYVCICGYAIGAISLITIISGIFIDFHYINIKIGLSVTETIEALLLGSWSIIMGIYTIKNYDKLEKAKYTNV